MHCIGDVLQNVFTFRAKQIENLLMSEIHVVVDPSRDESRVERLDVERVRKFRVKEVSGFKMVNHLVDGLQFSEVVELVEDFGAGDRVEFFRGEEIVLDSARDARHSGVIKKIVRVFVSVQVGSEPIPVENNVVVLHV